MDRILPALKDLRLEKNTLEFNYFVAYSSEGFFFSISPIYVFQGFTQRTMGREFQKWTGRDGSGTGTRRRISSHRSYPSRAAMFFAPIASNADCVRQPPVPAPMITTSFPPTPVPVPVVKTHLPTQVPTVGEAYILPFPFRQFPDSYPFTCLSVHHPGSHSSSPAWRQ